MALQHKTLQWLPTLHKSKFLHQAPISFLFFPQGDFPALFLHCHLSDCINITYQQYLTEGKMPSLPLNHMLKYSGSLLVTDIWTYLHKLDKLHSETGDCFWVTSSGMRIFEMLCIEERSCSGADRATQKSCINSSSFHRETMNIFLEFSEKRT